MPCSFLSGKEDSGSEAGEPKVTELEASEEVEELPAHFLNEAPLLPQSI